ncbi:hypothetical protein KXV81_006700 [Aspergillus fumigatus]|nr:hypothetical protein CNMCM8057_005616 [Aspergillus fumigatus]KMK58305.1 hypothetical protein Y699_03725 [Aspergillus fumigatus Z5]KAF4253846.1 hypothetical protein CNMCM8714_005817 [Aspergillus fumigatus]KAF4259757.1 hypothetical protein CNMCM8812_005725 [Aspergillus fumigatus]KAH1270731.1 hypothetical protein KXX45_001385 [Aspergillus fumigatus]
MAVLCTASQTELHSSAGSFNALLKSDRARMNDLRDINESIQVPDPRIFKDPILPTDVISLPNMAQCAAHLELLQAINHIRREVLNSKDLDAILDIKPEKRTVRQRYSQKRIEVKDPRFAQKRQAKWPFYVKLGVARFFLWLKKMEQTLTSNKNEVLELPTCPPLDVLIAWHSALLNPAWFRKYCKNGGIKHMRRVVFPWRQIHECINDKDWSFSLPSDAAQSFTSLTGQEADLLAYLLSPKPGPYASLLLAYRDSSPNHRPYLNKLDSLYLEKKEELPHSAFITSCYAAAHPGPYGAYLFDAIERQRVFVDKMVGYLWIRSPGVHGTLSRAITRYEYFLQLFKLRPGTTLVPTLDIDLVWHTHQCSASMYKASMKKLAGRFINHDDTIPGGVLRTQSDETSLLFRDYFGMDYHICLCWECEALQSAVDECGDGEVDFEKLANKVVNDLAAHRLLELKRRKQV